MAIIYVSSIDGNDADNGSTWALAKATVAGALAIAVAGDTIYVSQVHAESQATSMTLTSAGTAAAPIKIICVNDSAEPPTAVATTGSVTTTGTSNIVINGWLYVYGLSFNAASGAVAATLQINTATGGILQVYERCLLRMNSTAGSSQSMGFGAGNVSNSVANRTLLVNTDIRFSGAAHRISVSNGIFDWRGGSLLGSAITTFLQFGSNARGGLAAVSGVDLSAAATGVFLTINSSFGSNIFLVRNCKLPASWSGGVASGNMAVGTIAKMHNCDATDTNYRLWEETYAGSTKHETTVVKTGGADDGTTPISWRLSSNTLAEYPILAHESPEIVRWNETTGSAITVTVEILTDNVTLTDAECWIEVQYLGTSGFPLSLFVSDAKADILATAANQATSTETWTTTGIGAPVKQKLAVTFTPQEKGYIIAVVKLAKASTTVYVDPEITIT